MSPDYRDYKDRFGKGSPMGFRPRWGIYAMIIGVAALFLLFAQSAQIQKTTWDQFKTQMLAGDDVAKINIINNQRAEIFIRQESLSKPQYKAISTGFAGGKNPGPHFYLTIGSAELFEKHLTEAQAELGKKQTIPIEYINEEKTWWRSLLDWLLPVAILLLFWFFIIGRIARTAGGPGNALFDFGKASPELYEKGKGSNITFKDVAGYKEAKMEIMEIVEFLKEPQNFTRLGAKIPKGVLLVGAPGTGKTLMAKAVAGETGVPFFSLSGSEFIEMFVGVGASRVRDLFNKAKQKAPSIIFIDEIDTVGRVRGRAVSLQANDERDSTLNQLLAEMDGFGANTGVIVLAATNRADILDPALLRPGRFDRHIHLDLPDKEERVEIFAVHLKPLTVDKSVEAAGLAAQTPGFSGADIANVCNEAALIAARRKKNVIELSDFSDAIDRIVSGLEKRSRIISAPEKKIIAYHEAGHAIVGWMLSTVDPLQKVSVIPRGKSLGSAWYLPEERQIITRKQFTERLSAALGGRTAEELVFGDISSGALDDLERVTKQAYMMVAQLGLSDKIGNISYYDSTGLSEGSFQKPYSEQTAQLIDEEVRRLVDKAYAKAKEILENNRDKLEKLAALLLEKEVVYKPDLENVLGKRNTGNA